VCIVDDHDGAARRWDRYEKPIQKEDAVVTADLFQGPAAQRFSARGAEINEDLPDEILKRLR
jgi:hypothetical protein